MRVGVTAWLAGHGAAPQDRGRAARPGAARRTPAAGLLAVRGGRWALDVIGARRRARGAAGGARRRGAVRARRSAGLAMVAVPDDVVVDPARAGRARRACWWPRASPSGWPRGSAGPTGSATCCPTRRARRCAVPRPGWSRCWPSPPWSRSRWSRCTLGDVLGDGAAAGAGPGRRRAAGRRWPRCRCPTRCCGAPPTCSGPGFAVGTGTGVSPSGVVLGPLPAYPPFAALPAPGDAPGWASAPAVCRCWPVSSPGSWPSGARPPVRGGVPRRPVPVAGALAGAVLGRAAAGFRRRGRARPDGRDRTAVRRSRRSRSSRSASVPDRRPVGARVVRERAGLRRPCAGGERGR